MQFGVEIASPRTISVGNHCLITQGARLTTELASGWLELGDNVQVNRGARLDYSGGLTLDKDALVSENAVISTHDHGLDPRSYPKASELRIGQGVWIGIGAIIVPRVREIGDGAVIGAGAVVSRDVEPGTVVAGNPAQVIRKPAANYKSAHEG